jgi:3-hydroxyisobutyrate dehydrogenase-like beta-hydroxyacid dehydrogenase
LAEAGLPLLVGDRDEARTAPLKSLGAAVAATPADCAAGCDILFTSLPGPPQVEAVMTTAAPALRAGSLWIDTTTNRRELVQALAASLAERDIATIEAPVTGAVDGARQGRLTFFVGGSDAAFERAEPLLTRLGRPIRCGAVGTGNPVKLVTNLLWFVHAAVLGEGLLLGKLAGVELATVWHAIRESVGDSFVARHDAPSIFAGHYDPSFSLDLCLKDLALTQELARSLALPLPLGDAAQARYDAARQRYGGGAGELHVAKLLEEATATDLRLAGDWRPHWEAPTGRAP